METETEIESKKNKTPYLIGSVVLLALVLGISWYFFYPSREPKNMVIETQHGEIKIAFYPEDAPQTVARIKELVNQGFYDGLIFHKVKPGFVIEGGDPLGRGLGGSGKRIPAEFNDHENAEGTVAMTRLPTEPDSADSQFYISLGRHPHLDGKFTVFGQVTKGMDTVKKIEVGDKMIKVSLR